MIKLNDYLYDGHTVLSILHHYAADLKAEAIFSGNQIDLAHCNFLVQFTELLEHNDFLTSQSQRIREFYKLLAGRYPHLAFTFRGRIKSLIRAEEKFNGYITEYISDYYASNGTFPEVPQIKARLNTFRDLIAYRIVTSLPKCHLKPGDNLEQADLKYLYEIANALPEFLEERGFTAEVAFSEGEVPESDRLSDSVRCYYRDYIANPKPTGYQSLHITFFDNVARCRAEVQLRTKAMDDYAEIGTANHSGYEREQEIGRTRRGMIPKGACPYFDDAWERVVALKRLDFSKVDVNMFAATGKNMMNDSCGLYRGRVILPFEHLSGFQNDIID